MLYRSRSFTLPVDQQELNDAMALNPVLLTAVVAPLAFPVLARVLHARMFDRR
jgi:hypothetical protein